MPTEVSENRIVRDVMRRLPGVILSGVTFPPDTEEECTIFFEVMVDKSIDDIFFITAV